MRAPRFVPVGQARLQVLDAVAHDPRETAAVVATLDALRPEVVLVDRDRDDWERARAGRPGAYDERLLRALEEARLPARPDVLWREVRAWGKRTGARVGVIHPASIPPPAGRRGLRGLDKLLKKEGFEATGPRAAVEASTDHYVGRVPDLRTWLVERRDETARLLWTSLSGHAVRAVVVFAAPDADAVCHRLADLGRA